MTDTPIPPATEDDLKLDLEVEYKSHAGPYPSLIELLQAEEPLAIIRLAHHWKQEAERRVDPLDPDFKIALAYEERITTLEAALRETLPFFRSVIQGREFWTATCEQAYKRAMSEVSDTEENPTKHEYRRCPMCGRCAECGEENPTDD